MYCLKGQVGEGATCSVYYAESVADGAVFAIKRVARGLLKRHKALFREVAILSCVRHPNVITLHETYLTPENLYLVMELAGGMQLFDHIVLKKKYSEKDARELIRTVLEAVRYLHSLGIAHRDLKPENIMVVDHVIKIVDFGFAGFTEDEQDGYHTPDGGTIGYDFCILLSFDNSGF